LDNYSAAVAKLAFGYNWHAVVVLVDARPGGR